VLAPLVSLIPRQAQRVSIRSILAATLLDWEAVSLDLRRQLENKAIRVLKDVCGAEFAKHLRFCKREERRHEETIEIVSDVMRLEPSAQTRAIQKTAGLLREGRAALGGRPSIRASARAQI